MQKALGNPKRSHHQYYAVDGNCCVFQVPTCQTVSIRKRGPVDSFCNAAISHRSR
jgi:hypothetical protein